MVIEYEMQPGAAAAAYWFRWRTSTRFKAAVLLFGLIPAILIFAFLASALPKNRDVALAIALVAEIASPLLFAALIKQSSRRGPRRLMIDAGGVSTEVGNGHWQVGWSDVRDLAETPDYLFFLGRGINSVSIPASAFADAAEREEFVRRARRYLSSRP